MDDQASPSPNSGALLFLQSVGTRSNIQCLEKWYSQLSPSMVARGEWGSGDDRRLLRALFLRCGTACLLLRALFLGCGAAPLAGFACRPPPATGPSSARRRRSRAP